MPKKNNKKTEEGGTHTHALKSKSLSLIHLLLRNGRMIKKWGVQIWVAFECSFDGSLDSARREELQ